MSKYSWKLPKERGNQTRKGAKQKLCKQTCDHEAIKAITHQSWAKER